MLAVRLDPWLATVVAIYVWLVGRFWFLCDDSYITFRYARNLARGQGVTYNVGEEPVEGYSDFLWMLLSAACHAVGAPSEIVVPAVSAACGLILLLVVHDALLRRFGFDRWAALAGAVWIATAPAYALWSTSGLEPMPFALALWILFDRWVLASDDEDPRGTQAALAALAAALLRTEGVAWVAMFACVAFLARWLDDPTRNPRRAGAPILRSLAPFGLVFGVYTAWRMAYFGDWVPNTAHAKVGFGIDRIVRGMKYVGLYWLTFPTLALALLGTPWAILARPGRGVAVALLAVAFPAYGVAIGGDFMPMGRMLVPGIPMAVVLLATLWQALRPRFSRDWAAGVLAALFTLLNVLGGFDIHVVPHAIREALHFRLSDREFMTEYARWANMADNTDGFALRGRALKAWAPNGTRWVTKAIGVAGYHSDLYIYDQYGLVNREVALLTPPAGRLVESPGHDKAVEAAFFVKYDPDLLSARLVQGLRAPGLMKDTLEEWATPPDLMSRFVPDFEEVELEGEADRSFLLLVRRAEPWENAEAMWEAFPERRKHLLAYLKQWYEQHPELADRVERDGVE